MIFEDMYTTHRYYKNNMKQIPQKRVYLNMHTITSTSCKSR